MKNTLLILATLLISLGHVQAQGHNFNLRFWDGTFAYNQLIVKSNPHQQSIITVELSGAQINLGTKIEGNPEAWSDKDLMSLSLQKSDCQTLDIENKEVICTSEKVYVNQLRWQINNKITKTYSGIIRNLQISATKKAVSVTFDIPADEDFTPHQETITVFFPLTFF